MTDGLELNYSHSGFLIPPILLQKVSSAVFWELLLKIQCRTFLQMIQHSYKSLLLKLSPSLL